MGATSHSHPGQTHLLSPLCPTPAAHSSQPQTSCNIHGVESFLAAQGQVSATSLRSLNSNQLRCSTRTTPASGQEGGKVVTFGSRAPSSQGAAEAAAAGSPGTCLSSAGLHHHQHRQLQARPGVSHTCWTTTGRTGGVSTASTLQTSSPSSTQRRGSQPARRTATTSCVTTGSHITPSLGCWRLVWASLYTQPWRI